MYYALKSVYCHKVMERVIDVNIFLIELLPFHIFNTRQLKDRSSGIVVVGTLCDCSQTFAGYFKHIFRNILCVYDFF